MNSSNLTDQNKKLSIFEPESRTFPGLFLWQNTALDDDQLRALAKFGKARGGLCWWRMGTGKTRISLFWFATLQNIYRWSVPSICVIVCRRRAFYDWKQEIAKIFPYCDVWQDDIPSHPPSLNPCFLLLSEGMLAKSVSKFAGMRTIRAVIYDELWLYSNPRSAKSEAAYLFGMGRKCLGLSGTVMKARDLAEVWSQARCVSKHARLATSLTKFRSEYQITESYGGFPSFRPQPNAYSRIMEDLEWCADVHFPQSARKVSEQFHEVPATAKQRGYFRELKQYYSLDEHGMEFNSALQTAVKVQQISDGFVKVGEDSFIDFPTDKFEKLKDELEIILSAGERAIVWCAFRHTVELLTAQLPFATLQMVGGVDFDVAAWERGDAAVVIATEASGSSVNYFKDVPYAIYYSVNYKWLDLGQSQWRTNRKDSKHSECFYKYLAVEGSLDRHVLDVAMGAGDSEESLIRSSGVTKWLKGE